MLEMTLRMTAPVFWAVVSGRDHPTLRGLSSDSRRAVLLSKTKRCMLHGRRTWTALGRYHKACSRRGRLLEFSRPSSFRYPSLYPRLTMDDSTSGKSKVEDLSYGDAPYWNLRYSNEAPGTTFDWYQPYSELKGLFNKFLTKTSKILMVGCGNAGTTMGSRWPLQEILRSEVIM